MIRLLIADDHAIVRQGIRGFVATETDFTVVGEASTATEAVECARDAAPDVALVDLILPGEGVEAVRGIKQVSPETKVVVLTALDDDSRVVDVFEAGALSYLLKDTSPEDLVAALRRAAAGEATLHPRAATRLVQSIRPDAGRGELDQLTQREMEVLQLLAQGQNNLEIAKTLAIGERTVKTHVSAILSKFGLHDRTSAAALAWRRGWVRADQPTAPRR